jgi:hypothetical protein
MILDEPLPAPTASLPPKSVATNVPNEEKTFGAGASVAGLGVISSRMGTRVVPVGDGDNAVAVIFGVVAVVRT